MSGPVRLVWGDAFMRYVLSDDHPLRPERVKLAVELIEKRALDADVVLVPPREASDAELKLSHTAGYVEMVRLLSDPYLSDVLPRSEIFDAGFGSEDNPVVEDMHRSAATIVGGSLVAAESVHSGAALHAFNPAGGLHHAGRSRASGFCVYNDVAVAAAWLRDRGHRVACIDVDAHHGDGTEAIFNSDPQVLTVSLHESGRYLFPGTGFPGETGVGAGRGTAVNLPLQPYIWDEPWLAAFEAIVPPLLRDFKPTVLVTQDGCDTHKLDPLTHLQCSTAIWPTVGRRFHELAHELCEGRWVALGGGGYAVREVVPRAWTLLFAEMVERPELAADLADPAPFVPAPEAQERVWAFLQRDLRELSTALGTQLELAPR
jgi:acetoin utilization protein AcuC